MRKFGDLLINEWIKMYKKKTFFVPYAIMLAFVAIFTYVIYKLSPEGLNAAQDFTAGLMSVGTVGQLLPFIVVIFTAGIVSQEHRYGTIKFLLIRAQSRSKILASKYVVTLLFSFSLIAVTFLASLAAGVILYGFNQGEASWGSILLNTLYLAIYTTVYSTLTFMVGVLTKSSGATVGIGMFAMMAGGVVTMLLSSYSFTKFILFPNADLSVYSSNGPPVEGMTMFFSVIVLIVYVAVFLAASFVTFKKRDVA